MSYFLGGIAFLIAGYFLYGKVVEKILGPDDRKPSAAAPVALNGHETKITVARA